MNDTDSAGLTPLHKACEQGFPMIVDVLLRHQADITAVHIPTGDTAFHIVARCKRKSALECAQLLLRAGGVPSDANKLKKTPVEEADEAENPEIRDLLREALNRKKVHQKRSPRHRSRRTKWGTN